MEKEGALRIIFWISLVGVLFSGYMSYMEIFNGMCGLGTCRVDIQIAYIPACIYGLFMYLAIMIVACCGLKCRLNGNSNHNGNNGGNHNKSRKKK